MPTLADQFYFSTCRLALITLIMLAVVWLTCLSTAVSTAFGWVVFRRAAWKVDVGVPTGAAKELSYRLGKAPAHQNGFARAKVVFAVMQIASTTLRPAPSAR